MKQLVELGKVAEFINGFSFKPSDWENSGIKIIRIQNLTNSEKSYNRTTKEVPTKYIIRKGDILVSWSATLDVFEWDDEEDAFLNQHIFKVEPFENIIRKDYFKYALKYSIEEMSKFTHGSTMKHIVRKDFLKHKIPLPPIEEQHRIVKILDLAQSLIEKRKQAIAYLDDYIKAVFLDMFGDPVSNPKGWDKKTMSELTIKIGSGATPKGGKSSYVRDGISLIRSLNIHDNLFIDKNLAFINERQAKALSNVQVEENDVLLNITGASVGRCAVVPNRILPARVNQHVSILRTNEKLNPYFLLHLLISDSFKRKLLKDANAGGATREALTKQHIEDLEIICPPIEEQNRFCNIEKLDDILKQKMQSQLEELENNFQAEMQRAFQSD